MNKEQLETQLMLWGFIPSLDGWSKVTSEKQFFLLKITNEDTIEVYSTQVNGSLDDEFEHQATIGHLDLDGYYRDFIM